jgi:hypothetical protein
MPGDYRSRRIGPRSSEACARTRDNALPSVATASSRHGPVVMTTACSMPSSAKAAQRSANESDDSLGSSRVLTVFSISS